MADGMPLSGAKGSLLPKLHFEELETHELIAHLPPAQQQILWRVYPKIGKLIDVARSLGITPATLNNRIDATHMSLRRLIDQRRRGEALDAARPRPRVKVQRISVQADGRRVRLAAVAVDE
jgi:AraC-like DNA-binding protein